MWAAQAAFDTACSGGLNVNEYCSSAAAETCCGLCNVVPISGPGSILSNLLSTLLNLAFAMHFKSETPYTLFFQLWGMDFAVFSLIDRALQGKNRVSLFHYCWVPFTACSMVPLTVACCLSRLKYMHGLSSPAEVAISRGLIPPETPPRTPDHSPAGSSALGTVSEPGRAHTVTAHAMGKRNLNRTSSDVIHRHRDGTAAGGDSGALKKDKKSKKSKKEREASPPRSIRSHVSVDPSQYGKTQKILARTIVWAVPIHILFYAATFIGVYGFVGNTFQSACIEEYDLNQWRIGMGVFSAVMLLICTVFWFCLYKAMDANFRQEKKLIDGLEVFIAGFCAVFHLARLKAWVLCREDWRTMKKRKNALRWGISIFVYLLWAIPYAFLYIKAGNDFLLPGLNPWPYEQIAGAVGILTPICIVARSYVNEKDGYDGKRKAIEDAKIVKLHGHAHGLFKDLTAPQAKPSQGLGITLGGFDNNAGEGSSKHPHGHGGHEDGGGSRQHGGILPLEAERSDDDLPWLEDDFPRRKPRQAQVRTRTSHVGADGNVVGISPLSGNVSPRTAAPRLGDWYQPGDALHQSERVPAGEFPFPAQASRRAPLAPLREDEPEPGSHSHTHLRRASSARTTASEREYLRDAGRIGEMRGDVGPAVAFMRQQDEENRRRKGKGRAE
ncbi:hypothetical protein JCM10449v2_001724 [Rhodotorula kratochvilovae]